jgi:phage portal protein BeeE
MPKMGEKEQLRVYRGWAYAYTNAIAERIADIELKYQEKTEDGWQDFKGDSEPMKTLQWVNDFMSFSELAFNYAAFQELNGNSFWYIVYNGNGKPVEIWPRDPTRVRIAKDDKEFVRGYVFINDKQEQVPLKREEVVHFKHFHPMTFTGV